MNENGTEPFIEQVKAAGNLNGTGTPPVASNDSSEPKILDLRDWLSTGVPPIEHVITDCFGPGDKVLIAGKSKVRKSFFAMAMGLSIAAGKEFLGLKIEHPRRVLFLQLELKEEWFKRRLLDMQNAMNLNNKNIEFHIINGRGYRPWENTTDENGKNWIQWLIKQEEIILKIKPEVIFIDPFYKVGDFDEIDIREIKALLSGLDVLAKKTGAAIVYVHHDKKGPVGDLDLVDRGSGSGVLGRDWDAFFSLLTDAVNPDVTILQSMFRNFKSPENPVALEFLYPYHFLSDEIPVLPSRKSGSNPTSAMEIESFVTQAIMLLSNSGPITSNEVIGLFRDKLKFTRDRSRQLYELFIRTKQIECMKGQRKKRVPDLWGLPGDIQKIREQRGE